MKSQAPELVSSTEDGRKNEFKHPAFGTISVYKTSASGDGTTLFGSALNHNQYITIELSKADLVRDFNHDRHMSRDVISRFAMSEAQWARFVSAIGNGSGIPVTLQYAPVDGTNARRCPDIDMENDRVRYTEDVKR